MQFKIWTEDVLLIRNWKCEIRWTENMQFKKNKKTAKQNQKRNIQKQPKGI